MAADVTSEPSLSNISIRIFVTIGCWNSSVHAAYCRFFILTYLMRTIVFVVPHALLTLQASIDLGPDAS